MVTKYLLNGYKYLLNGKNYVDHCNITSCDITDDSRNIYIQYHRVNNLLFLRELIFYFFVRLTTYETSILSINCILI